MKPAKNRIKTHNVKVVGTPATKAQPNKTKPTTTRGKK